jgi:hypothetical protein
MGWNGSYYQKQPKKQGDGKGDDFFCFLFEREWLRGTWLTKKNAIRGCIKMAQPIPIGG